MTYINRIDLDTRQKETVSEYNGPSAHRGAKIDLAEYRLSDPYGEYYISSRCCKDWRE